MEDWVDDRNEREDLARRAKDRFWEIFPGMADRAWDGIKKRITGDAAKLNETSKSLRGQITINKRPIIPSASTLYVDNETFPTVLLEITVLPHAKCIKILQSGRTAPDANFKDSKETLNMDLDGNDQVVITDPNGQDLRVPDGVSKYILERFLR